MRARETPTGDETMNANQKLIVKDATRIILQLRKLGTKEGHKAADELNQRVAKMIEAAA